MRELTDDLVRRVASDYGMTGHALISGTVQQLRAVMEWARDEARAETVREYLLREQQQKYAWPDEAKQSTQGEH